MASTVSPLWHRTPLIYSEIFSSRLGCDVYLKLEILQPSQSFKLRGQSLFAQEAFAKHGPSLHLVIASGGNAALALAHAAHTLGVKCTVFITEEAAKKSLVEALERLGAHPAIGGKDYAEALTRAEVFVQSDEKIVMAPAYDNPTLWEGISSMIVEIAEDLPKTSAPPDAILCSVGGGSLVGGTMTGCDKVGWDNTTIVALETQGAECFYHSVMSSTISSHPLPEGVMVHSSVEHGVKVARLPRIASRASSLGASSPAAGVVKKAMDRKSRGKGGVVTVTVPDELGMLAGLEFADDHKMNVELACSTTLTPIYSPALFNQIFGDSITHTSAGKRHTLVFIVCGGFKISLAELEEYRAHLESTKHETRHALVDGDEVLL